MLRARAATKRRWLWLERRLVRDPESDVTQVLLAACYGHLGRAEEARAVWQEALRINPDYSIEHRRQILPYKNPADLERMVLGLRKVGVIGLSATLRQRSVAC